MFEYFEFLEETNLSGSGSTNQIGEALQKEDSLLEQGNNDVQDSHGIAYYLKTSWVFC